MKKLIYLPILLILFVSSGFASTLIWKGNVTTTDSLVRTPVLHAQRYQQLRIYVKRTSPPENAYLRPDGSYSKRTMLVMALGAGDYSAVVCGSCSSIQDCTFLVDTPPDRIEIEIAGGAGSFRVFVWGS